MRKKLFDEQEAKQFAFISGIKNKFHVIHERDENGGMSD